MRSLITGVGGFAGQHLAARLLGSGETVFGVARGAVRWHRSGVADAPGFELLTADLVSAAAARQVVDVAAPDHVYLLAADSSVHESFRDPLSIIHNNAACIVNVLEAIRLVAPEARLLVVSSSEVYGRVPGADAIGEGCEFRPESPYAVSKATQDLLGYHYWATYGLSVVRVRPFNHIGPGQSDRFAAAAFARQIAEIEAGRREPRILVGNLEAQRDFTDVRDVVRAYELACRAGEPGAAYNIGRGTAVPIQRLLDELVARSRVEVDVRVDPDRLRRIDAPLLVCDARRFRAQTGWQPELPLEVTLDDILNDWRERIAGSIA